MSMQSLSGVCVCVCVCVCWGGGGCTPYNGLYGEAPPERGTFFRLQVYERVGVSLLEVYETVGKSVICHLGL